MVAFQVQPALGSPYGSWPADMQLPNVCPICHFAIVPTVLNGYALGPTQDSPIECVLRCTRYECQHVFIAECEPTGDSTNNQRVYRSGELKPQTPQAGQFDAIIGSVSPSFIAIHEQAMVAESHDLDQVVGIGLRKSLEFLIKDFLIRRHPDKADQIKTKLLALCIKDYVEDDKLKDCALRAAWLGNDETHYVRKWTDKDVSDLKRLIRLTALWIERIEYTDEFIKDMPPSGPA